MKKKSLPNRAFAAVLFATATTATSGFAAPSATSSPPNVTSAGGTSYSFSVTFQDPGAINGSSIGTGEVGVSVPSGFSATPHFVFATPSGNAPSVAATYSFTPPGGSWDITDNGTPTRCR